MINCIVSLEIKNYEPQIFNINFPQPACLFQFDNFEGQISLNQIESQNIQHNIKNLNKDIKYKIKLINLSDSSLIGIFDFIIPFILLKKIPSNNILSYQKICSLTMLDETKRFLFGSLINASDIFFDVSANVQILNVYKKQNIFYYKNNKNNCCLTSPNIYINNNKLKSTPSFSFLNHSLIKNIPQTPKMEKKIYKNNLYLENIDYNYKNEDYMLKTPSSENKSNNSSNNNNNNIKTINNNNYYNNYNYNNIYYNDGFKTKKFYHNTYSNFNKIQKNQMNNSSNLNTKENNKNRANKFKERNTLKNNTKNSHLRYSLSFRETRINSRKNSLILNGNYNESFENKKIKNYNKSQINFHTIGNIKENSKNNSKKNNNNNIINKNINKTKKFYSNNCNQNNNTKSLSNSIIENGLNNDDKKNSVKFPVNITDYKNKNNKNLIIENINDTTNNTKEINTTNEDENYNSEYKDENDISLCQSELLNNNNIENNKNEKLENDLCIVYNMLFNNIDNFDQLYLKKNKNKKEFKNNIFNSINLFIKFHELINVKILILQNKNKILKNIYKENALKKKNIIKKQNKLIQKNLENNLNLFIRVNIDKTLNNSIKNKIIQTRKNEYKIFENIFNFQFFENKQNFNNIMTDKEKIDLFLKVIQILIQNFGNISQIYEDDEDNKIRLKALFFRYNIKEKEELNQYNMNIINMNLNALVNNEINKIKSIKEVDEDKEEDNTDEENEEEINNNDNNNDNMEKKIEDILLNEYNNKKNVKIKFEKINQFQYKYGTQKIIVKFENDEIFVQFGNGYITLDKFIERNEPIEETKMLLNKNNLKNNKILKLYTKNANLYNKAFTKK